MIDEAQQDLAAAYVLGELDATQAARFEETLAHTPELQALVHQLHDAAEALAVSEAAPAPPLAPLVRTLRTERAAPAKVVRGTFLPWALAASIALACGVLGWIHRADSRRIASLEARNEMSQMRIAMLTAQAEAYARAVAVVVWDDAHQRGRVKLAQIPAPGSGHDYQLWIIDPRQPAPVSAGLLLVDSTGAGNAEFSPDRPVGAEGKFAVSLEPAGGSPAPRGPVVLVGN